MKKTDLTKGNVLKVIIALALPIMGSSLLQFTYNLIDMLFVGRLGSNAVASIGASSLYINIGNAINSLVVVGTGIKVAHAVGRKDNDDVQKYINSGMIINIFIGIVFGIILLVGGKSFIGFLSLNNREVEKNAYYYLAINAPILFFSFFNMMYTRILGSFGNNKLPLRLNAIGVIINIILDPVFIYVLKFGVSGAAISTLISSIIIFILFRTNSNGIFKYNFKIKIDFERIKEIIKLGLPMSYQRVLFTIIGIMIAKIVAVFGSDAIAAQKIGAQIEAVAFMVLGGFNGAIASFTGQNFGAKKFNRIKEGYKNSLIVGISYAFIMAAVFLIFNKNLISLFIREENTILIASDYLKAVAFSQSFTAVEMVSTGFFTGIGKPKIPSLISIIFTSLRIPLSLILIKYYGIDGVWMSISLSSILKGIFTFVFYKIQMRKPSFIV